MAHGGQIADVALDLVVAVGHGRLQRSIEKLQELQDKLDAM